MEFYNSQIRSSSEVCSCSFKLGITIICEKDRVEAGAREKYIVCPLCCLNKQKIIDFLSVNLHVGGSSAGSSKQ